METEDLLKLAQIASEVENPNALEAFKLILDRFNMKDGEDLSQKESTDGVYVIYKSGFALRYKEGMEITDVVKYIGLKIGSKSIAVALKDVSDKEITLTINKDETSYKKYVDNSIDALSDWDGKENTEHMKEIGLNPEIKLEEGEYIAAGGEFSFINLFVKSINEALKAVGGGPLSGWYWTSSETSAAYAWYLTLGNGSLGTNPKVSTQNRVRAVAAFSL
jgi:hypothetical protein